MAKRKTNLLFMKDFQAFMLSCDDADAWISEKYELSSGVMRIATQTDSIYTIERLTKQHEETITSLNNFQTSIEQLKLQGEELLGFIDCLISEVEKEAEATNHALEGSVKSKEGIRNTIKNRIKNLSDSFSVLTKCIRQTQLLLLDAVSLHQLFQMASSTYNWITEKEIYMQLLIMDDLQEDELSRIMEGDIKSNQGLIQRLEIVKNRFSDLEEQMSTAAEQVSNINNMITSFLNEPKRDDHSLVNEEMTIEKVINLQDHLNSAWNRIADTVESHRDRITEESFHINLFIECKYTSEWITEKEAVLLSTDSIDTNSLSGLVELRRRLYNLQGDLKAIEARVQNIGERIGELLGIREHEEVYDEDTRLKSRRRADYLMKEHMRLTQQWLNLKEALKNRVNRISTEGQVSRFLEKLDSFQDWMRKLKTDVFIREFPNDLQETENRLTMIEQSVQEIKDYENEANQLFETGKQILKGYSDTSHVMLGQRLAGLEDDWKSIQNTMIDCTTRLQERYALQCFLAESALLEVTLDQQSTFLDREDALINLDTVRDVQKQYETFHFSLLTCKDRVDAALELGRKVAERNPSNRERALAKCELFQQKYEANRIKTDERIAYLQEKAQLYEFYEELEDFEDWILDKTNSLVEIQLAIKQRSHLSFSRIQAFEEEIEANRNRGDHFIEVGQKLIEVYPHLENDVKSHLERLHTRWEELVELVRHILNVISQDNREKLMKEAIQKTAMWLKVTNAHLQKADEKSPVEVLDMITLQTQIKDHNKRVKEYMDQKSVISVLKHQASAPDFNQREEFSAIINDLERKLSALNEPLNQKLLNLKLLQTSTQGILDLTLEGTWVREKLLQIENLSKTLELDPQKAYQIGQRLMVIHRLERQLKSHILEANNRRPRVKALCKNIEKEYCVEESNVSVAKQQQFTRLIQELLDSWNKLDRNLTCLLERITMSESVYQFLLDAGELESWISEEDFYLHGVETPKTEQSALNNLKKHQTRSQTIEQWHERVKNHSEQGRILCQQLQIQQTKYPDTNIIQESQFYLKLIPTYLNRISHSYKSLQGIVNDVTTMLEANAIRYGLTREADELEAWINKRVIQATNNDLGNDLDHCCNLRDKFLIFSKETTQIGSRLVASLSAKCVHLITLGRSDSVVIASIKDNINEIWAELLELIETRRQLLKAALDMHRFVNDCRDFEERICYRLEYLPEAPSDSLASGRKQGLPGLQRSHNLLEQELACFSDQLKQLDLTAKRLLPRYAGLQEEQLQAHHERVQMIWKRLLKVIEIRRELLKEASRLHDFLVSARELISWLEYAKDLMEHKERPRDISGVEYLIEDHKQLRVELESRNQRIEDCLNLGRVLLTEFTTEEAKPSVVTSGKPSLIATRTEVRERCVQLATGRILLNELWRERWDRLHLLLEIRQFARDANSAEIWLIGKELQLESARRQLGETLAETLSLLGAHYAFQQTLATADERFNALKRLTTLEIRAMKWDPQEITMRENEKRTKVRNAVKEFLPTYVEQPGTLKKSNTTLPLNAIAGPSTRIPLASAAYIQQPPSKAVRKQAEADEIPIVPTRANGQISSTRSTTLLAEKTPTPKKIQQSYSSAEKELEHQEALMSPKPVKRIRSKQIADPIITRNVPVVVTKEESLSAGHELADASQRSGSPSENTQSYPENSPTNHSRMGEASDGSSNPQTPEASDQSDGNQQKLRYRSRSMRVESSQSDLPLVGKSSPISKIKVSEDVKEAPKKLLPEPEAATSEQPPLPRLEGPVIRKHDMDPGGSYHSKSHGRSWLPLYLVLDSGQLFVYKDHQCRREKPNVYYHNEAPLNLLSASAAPAIDYTKRPCIFRLRLGDGSEYLFQTANDNVLNRWVAAINESAKCLTSGASKQPTTRSLTLPISSRSNGHRRSIKTFFSVRRKS
ncbi:unnamed protein product [Heterobilharzia americana]|nr:unnamed protein product [Heterobilharzia americana]